MTEISPSGQRWAAVAMFANAAFMTYGAATTNADSDAPAWVLLSMALLFFSAGVVLMKKASGTPANNTWFAFLFCLLMGIVFAWVPFGGHPEKCTSTSSFLFFSHTTRGDRSCLRAFGIVGWLLIALAILIAVRWIRSTFGKPKSYY